MNVLSWYFTKKALPYWCILLLDCMIIIISNFLVLILNYGISYVASNLTSLISTIFVYLLCYIIGFRVFHTYSGIIRYSSFVDLQRTGYAILLGLTLIIVGRIIFTDHTIITSVRVSDVVLSALLSILSLWTIRILIKYLYDSYFHVKQSERIFIYGVKHGGVGLAKSIRNQDPAKYILTGFVSDEPDIKNKSLMGVPVYPNDENLVGVMKKKIQNTCLYLP